MITMSLGKASDIMAVELTSKKKATASPVPRTASSRHARGVDLQKKGHCTSNSQVLIRMAVYVGQYFSTSVGKQTHF